MTLALLLTAVGGAWAQEESLLTTITPTAKEQASYSTANVATVSFSYTANGSSGYLANWGWWGYGWSATVNAAEGYTITKCIFYDDANRTATDSEAPFVVETTEEDKTPRINGTPIDGGNMWSKGIKKIEVYGYQSAIDVKWDAATKTGSFVMPAFDVEIAPIYAPVAQWAKVENVDQIPTAIDGIIAGEAKAIVSEGTVAKAGSTNNTQGTVMYLTTTDANMTAAQARDAATGWTSTVPTGAVLTGGFDKDQTVYVWYYIQGANTPDEQTATAENTFNDSEICTTPLTVTLKANQFNLTFSPAPVSNATVTVGGNAATAEQLNAGKIEKVGTGTEIKLKAATGYKFKKVEVKKTSTPK